MNSPSRKPHDARAKPIVARAPWMTRMFDSWKYYVGMGVMLLVMDAVFVIDFFVRKPTLPSVLFTVVFTLLAAGCLWFGLSLRRRLRARDGE